MSVTPEELAAFADGELAPARAAEVARAVAADAALAEDLRKHRQLRARLGEHFAPIVDAPLPETLTAPLRSESNVVSFAAASEARLARRTPRWAWLAAPALAASLVLAVVLSRGPGDGYAAGGVADALEGQLVASQGADAEPRILLSFRDEGGAFCRAFAGAAESGIACKDGRGWRLRTTGPGVAAERREYGMAGNEAARLLESAQAMAAGGALDAAQEREARARNWR